MTKTVLYSAAIASVGILLIAVMSFDVTAHASGTETEREFDVVTFTFRAMGSVTTFVVGEFDPDSETYKVQMRKQGDSSVVCDVPKEFIKIKRPLSNLSIEYDTNDSDINCTRNADLGGVVSLTVVPNGEFSEKHKSDNTICSLNADRITVDCIRVQETSEGGTVDVSGTLFGKSFDNGKGEMGLMDSHIKTWTEDLND